MLSWIFERAPSFQQLNDELDPITKCLGGRLVGILSSYLAVAKFQGKTHTIAVYVQQGLPNGITFRPILSGRTVPLLSSTLTI